MTLDVKQVNPAVVKLGVPYKSVNRLAILFISGLMETAEPRFASVVSAP